MTTRTLEDAHKLVYLIQEYPDKKMPEILEMFAMPALNINAALWAAAKLGFIADTDKLHKSDKPQILDVPETWVFGKVVDDLIETLVYCFEVLGTRETDLEENQLLLWMRGYASQDICVAIKRAIETGQMAEYAIEDGDNTYLFYTLGVNRDKQWGRKNFKTDPLPDKKGKK